MMSNILKLNLVNIYIVLYVLYSLQGFMYASGSLMSQSLILFIILIGLYSFIGTIFLKQKILIVKLLIFFFLMQALSYVFSDKTVYGYLYEAVGQVSTSYQFKKICVAILSFFVSFKYIRKKNISEKNLFIIGLLLIAVSLVQYYVAFQSKLSILGENQIGFTNNGGYKIVTIIPFLPFVFKRNKILAYILIISSLTLIIYASKRGAIVCTIACFLYTLFFYIRKKKVKVSSLLILLFLLIIFLFFISYLYESNEYLQRRIEKTQDEGIGARNIAYFVLWNHWVNDNNIIIQFFGNGMSQSVSIWGNYAHNDWLELLINNGLLGVIVYILIFLCFFKDLKNIKIDYYRFSGHLCLIIWFLKTLFSMGYTETSSSVFLFLLGVIIGKNEYYKVYFQNKM